MGICDGRVVIVTGSGRGIGREHALAYAAEGAKVVVNDLGGDMHGDGGSLSPAMEVVEEIKGMGGEAVADGENVADFAGAGRMVQRAIDTFGSVDTIVNTSSPSGIFGNAGQTNYGAAKAGVAAFTIICGLELVRYGVCANAIAPVARTRMTEQLMGGGGAPAEGFDALDPANISPLVVWLGSNDNADVNGRVFLVDGDRVSVAEGWRRGPTARNDGMRWEPAQLTKVVPGLVAEAQPNSTMMS